jgi:hypothetical protein
VPEQKKENGFAVEVHFREGNDELLPEEIDLIGANLPGLLKLMLEEMGKTEGERK